MYYLYNNKKLKRKHILNKLMFNLFTLFFVLYIFKYTYEKFYIMSEYIYLKAVWTLLLYLYSIIYKRIKIKIEFLFKNFLAKNLILALSKKVGLKKFLINRNFYLKNFSLKYLMEKKILNKDFCRKIMYRRKKFMKIKAVIKKKKKRKIKNAFVFF